MATGPGKATVPLTLHTWTRTVRKVVTNVGLQQGEVLEVVLEVEVRWRVGYNLYIVIANLCYLDHVCFVCLV